MFLPVSVMVTLASATMPPEASTTVPPMLPYTACPEALLHASTQIKSSNPANAGHRKICFVSGKPRKSVREHALDIAFHPHHSSEPSSKVQIELTPVTTPHRSLDAHPCTFWLCAKSRLAAIASTAERCL